MCWNNKQASEPDEPSLGREVIRQVLPQHRRVCTPLLSRRYLGGALSLVKVVAFESWKNMQMIVPDVLISRRFVVLSRRDAVAVIGMLEGERNGLGDILNAVSIHAG